MTLDRNCVSVVVPLYNEQDTLLELWQRLQASLAALPFEKREILLVSDGSTDRSEEIIADLVHRCAEAKGVFLTRNFGHQAAVSIGLAESIGSVVAVMDGDLQDPPEVLPRLIAASGGGRRGLRHSPEPERDGSPAHGLPRLLSSAALRRRMPNAFGLRRLLLHAARGRRGDRPSAGTQPLRPRFACLGGLSASRRRVRTGLEVRRQTEIHTAKPVRPGLRRPLFLFQAARRAIQFTGFLVALVSLLVALAYVVWYLLAPQSFPQGFATLVVSIWFLGGVQLFSLGVLGEYVTRTCDESRRRPVALVRQVLVNPNPGLDASAVRRIRSLNPAVAYKS